MVTKIIIIIAVTIVIIVISVLNNHGMPWVGKSLELICGCGPRWPREMTQKGLPTNLILVLIGIETFPERNE